MATFDGNGLVIDRLDDVKNQINADLKDAFGDGINLEETSPFGVIVGIMSERYAQLYELLEAVYNASFPNTAFGIYLDELAAFNGVVREQATFSTVTLQFTRQGLSTTEAVPIPAGTQVTAPAGSTTIWSTVAAAEIAIGNLTTSVQAQPTDSGPIGALAGTLTSLVQPVANVASVNNPADADPGQAEETDSELKIRREAQLGRSGTSTEQGIRAALTLLDELRNATVATNDTDIPAGGQVEIGDLTYDAALVTGNSIQVFLNNTEIAGSPVAFNTDNLTTLSDIAAAIQAEADVATAVSDGVDKITITGATLGQATYTASLVTGGASQAIASYVRTQAPFADRPPHSIECFGAVASGSNFGQISQIVYDAPFVADNLIEIFIDAGSIGTVLFVNDQQTTLDAINALLVADSRIASSTNDGTLTVAIQGSSAASLVISTSVTGGVSQPNGIWSQLAPAGDTLDTVAQTIWDSKAAGIQTTGTFEGVATDTSGDLHVMYFSEILDVRVWVRLTLTVNGEYDQGTSETAMAQAIQTYSELNLTAGVDVLNYKLLCAASDVGSAGVLDIISETSLDGVSFAQSNITIDVSQFADISASDVSFVYP
jgi:uncharacterized phage protein gp47/JayE